MEIKNVYDVNVDDLFNLLKEVIGVFFCMEEMFFEEIQKSRWINIQKYFLNLLLDFVFFVLKFLVYDVVY